MPAALKGGASVRVLQAAAERHLAEHDKVLSRLIPLCGPCTLGRASARLPTDAANADSWGAERSPFETLGRAIAHQQLNGLAAESILARLAALFGTQRFPSPEQLVAADPTLLRGAGFSFAKVAALKDLAAKTLEGAVPDAPALALLTDEAIIERLTTVRGIGRWTVEMLLIFQLARPDVLPIDDFGVQNGFRLAYGLSGLPRPRALATYGERWRPHRSVAAWYLWRAVELAREGRLPRCARPPNVELRAGALPRASASAPAGARSGASAPPRPTDARSSRRHPRGSRSRAPGSKKRR
jgi:DNA-3-methyladenine glycosylase II